MQLDSGVKEALDICNITDKDIEKKKKGSVCSFTEKKLPNLTLQGTNQKIENGRTNKYKLNKHKDKKEDRNIGKYVKVYRMKTLRERCSHKTTMYF